MTEIEVRCITSPADLGRAYQIRRIVFMEEQKVGEEDEFDGLDEASVHYLVTLGGEAVGTARWRHTQSGIKLERFAVLSDFRGKGVARELLKEVLKQVVAKSTPDERIYLHAQVSVLKLYEAEGFESIGEQFEECGITHVEMEYRR